MDSKQREEGRTSGLKGNTRRAAGHDKIEECRLKKHCNQAGEGRTDGEEKTGK